MAEDVSERLRFRLEVCTASEVTRLAVCGNFQGWQLSTASELKYTEGSGEPKPCLTLQESWLV
jgi:hypothetical protein